MFGRTLSECLSARLSRLLSGLERVFKQGQLMLIRRWRIPPSRSAASAGIGHRTYPAEPFARDDTEPRRDHSAGYEPAAWPAAATVTRKAEAHA